MTSLHMIQLYEMFYYHIVSQMNEIHSMFHRQIYPVTSFQTTVAKLRKEVSQYSNYWETKLDSKFIEYYQRTCNEPISDLFIEVLAWFHLNAQNIVSSPSICDKKNESLYLIVNRFLQFYPKKKINTKENTKRKNMNNRDGDISI